MTDVILFYGHESGPYAAFSNWYDGAPVELDGATWATTEHYFMAQKTTDKKLRETIRRARDAAHAKELGNALALRPGWDGMKFDVMRRAVRAKFTQHEDLRVLLLSTGSRRIHEDCADPWWGGGPNFPAGRDWLGRILMDVRGELRGR